MTRWHIRCGELSEPKKYPATTRVYRAMHEWLKSS
jgi:hypothetical protein